VLLYPNLGEPVRAGPARQLAFFVTARAGGPQEAEIALLRDGRERVRQTLGLSPPGPDGIVRLVGSLPLEGLDPGGYELRFWLGGTDPGHARRAFFTVMTN
jgi:hypothetical protein